MRFSFFFLHPQVYFSEPHRVFTDLHMFKIDCGICQGDPTIFDDITSDFRVSQFSHIFMYFLVIVRLHTTHNTIQQKRVFLLFW